MEFCTDIILKNSLDCSFLHISRLSISLIILHGVSIKACVCVIFLKLLFAYCLTVVLVYYIIKVSSYIQKQGQLM